MDDERRIKAQDALDKVLRDYADIFGPHDDMEDEEGELVPEGIYLPTHWVLSSEWSEMESGDTWTRISASIGSSRAMKIGLGILASEAWIS
jgi:hypothetical protein